MAAVFCHLGLRDLWRRPPQAADPGPPYVRHRKILLFREDQQMIELCVDADRLKYNGDIGDWFDDVDEKMLLAFDAYEVYPDEFWKDYADKNDIKMWMLR